MQRSTASPIAPPSRRTDFYHGLLSLSQAQIVEIIKATQEFPAKLASIRRLLCTGRDPDSLLENLPEELPGLFDLEWSAVDPGDREQHLVLALLGHDGRAYTADEVAEITDLSSNDVEAKLGGLAFVRPDDQGYYRFPAESARRFVQKKLEHLRQRVNELLINFYSRDPDDPEAISQLPSLYFRSEGKLLDLVQFLSPERFARIYQTTPSIKAVRKQADLGIQAARELQRTGDLIRFTLQRATIEEIADSEIGVAEVRARAAVGDYENALALAEAAPRHEVRLHLLVAMAKVVKSQGDTHELDLLPRIQEILRTVDLDALSPRLADILSDLFHVSPELAIELAGGRTDGERGENAMDWAITGLAIQAQLEAARAEDDPNAKKHANLLREQIRDPKLRRLSMQAIAVLGRLSAPLCLD